MICAGVGLAIQAQISAPRAAVGKQLLLQVIFAWIGHMGGMLLLLRLLQMLRHGGGGGVWAKGVRDAADGAVAGACPGGGAR